jgi:hypothetical protein
VAVAKTKEKPMLAINKAALSIAMLALTAGASQAGPCNTGQRDAGSGNVPGYTGQTTGTASSNTKQHPPTESMNKATNNTAASSQDTQRQMQNKPTAAQQAQGAKTASGSQDGC